MESVHKPIVEGPCLELVEHKTCNILHDGTTSSSPEFKVKDTLWHTNILLPVLSISYNSKPNNSLVSLYPPHHRIRNCFLSTVYPFKDMALHLFHLTPENELAKAAVVSRIKQGRAKHVIFDYGTKDESECGCIPVVIERDIEKQWCFTIGNDCNSDLFLPIPGGTRIDCKFYFIESFYEPDKAHLAFRSRSSNEVKILDPINEEEQRTGKMDLIYQNTRYLERPTQLFIGPYRFAIRMPEKSDESASDIVRKRQVAEKLPENYKETDWRETDFLGKGCSGIVHRVRGMNTGAELARKTITDDAFDISELAEEVALISIFDHVRSIPVFHLFRVH